LSTKILRSLYVLCGLGAVAVVAACNASSNSSAVAPLPIQTAGPSTIPSSPTPKPTVTPKPTPSPTPTPAGTPTPTPTPSPTGSGGCLVEDPCTQPLVDAGGELLVPSIGTFTGTAGYATNDSKPKTTITFTTCTTNCFSAPNPHGGTPTFWLRAAACCDSRGYIQFNDGNQVATLTSSTLQASQTYWLCAYIGSFVIPGGPLPAGSPTNGTLTYPSPLTGQALQGTGGKLPTGKNKNNLVNIDTVLTAGMPTSC